jgi:dolichyl-phosphate-mannose--protein O-mannosyl transferase
VFVFLFCFDDLSLIFFWVDIVAPDAPKVNYRLPGFLSKFWELQRVMWTTNAGLTDRHTFDSRPNSWPLLRRGIVSWGYILHDDPSLMILFLVEFLGEGPSSNLPHW